MIRVVYLVPLLLLLLQLWQYYYSHYILCRTNAPMYVHVGVVFYSSHCYQLPHSSFGRWQRPTDSKTHIYSLLTNSTFLSISIQNIENFIVWIQLKFHSIPCARYIYVWKGVFKPIQFHLFGQHKYTVSCVQYRTKLWTWSEKRRILKGRFTQRCLRNFSRRIFGCFRIFFWPNMNILPSTFRMIGAR